MSSHWEWAEQVIARHNRDKPFSPENGKPLKFKEGDPVIHTNDFGVTTALRIRALYRPEEMTAQYALGKRYLLDWDCYWFPVAEATLTLDASRVTTTEGTELAVAELG